MLQIEPIMRLNSSWQKTVSNWYLGYKYKLQVNNIFMGENLREVSEIMLLFCTSYINYFYSVCHSCSIVLLL